MEQSNIELSIIELVQKKIVQFHAEYEARTEQLTLYREQLS